MITFIKRYGLASFSAAAVSGAHLLIQLMSVARFNAHEIGTLAFMMVIITFGYGVSNALICTPYAVMSNQVEDKSGTDFSYLYAANSLLCISYGAVAGITGILLFNSSAVTFAVASLLSLVRWFGRSWAYAAHEPNVAAMSDFVYTTVLIGVASVGWTLGITLPEVGLGIACASAIALIPFGMSFLRAHFSRQGFANLRSYGSVWREQASWTLTGVISTEATSNAHSYIVTAFAGSAAFAPLAVAQLFFRPVGVCVTALTQLERPRMARAIGAGRNDEARAASRHFLVAIVGIWFATAILACTVLIAFPQLIAKRSVPFAAVATAVCLLAVQWLIACIQAPASVLAQARGAFKPLALASVVSSSIGIPATLLLCSLAPPVWTIAGVALAQAFLMFYILRLNRRWKDIVE